MFYLVRRRRFASQLFITEFLMFFYYIIDQMQRTRYVDEWWCFMTILYKWTRPEIKDNFYGTLFCCWSYSGVESDACHGTKRVRLLLSLVKGFRGLLDVWFAIRVSKAFIGLKQYQMILQWAQNTRKVPSRLQKTFADVTPLCLK